MLRRLLLLPLLFLAPLTALPENDTASPPAKGAGKVDPKTPVAADPYAGLKLRSIGPALFSGRVVGFAVNPSDRSHYYAAVGSGGVWKTTNTGVSWTPVFDKEGSYSIGYVALDPKNVNTVWVGTGENNSQRSVGYGDGVYKSIDGARTWSKMGLEKSEHIGKILIDPRDSNIVYIAAQGPLWGPGGDRGLYKTTNGGKTWNKVLSISENTGVTDIVLDPRNPDILLAASYQRRRHVYTLIDGGPESRASIDPPMPASRGRRSLRDCPRSIWGESAWQSRRPIRTLSTPASKRPTARAAYFDLSMEASPGSGATPSTWAPCIMPTWLSIRRTPTESTS